MEITIQQLADEMYNLVRDYTGKKKFKPSDLVKEMEAKYGVSKEEGKQALKELIDSERCVYTYAGGSFIEIANRGLRVENDTR
jgi:hypothetical protein